MKQAVTNDEWALCAHPTKKDENGQPLFDMNKMEEILRKKIFLLIEEAEERIESHKSQTQAAADGLRSEMAIVGQFVDSAKTSKKELVETFRSMRVTTATEVASMIKPLEELRKFFLGNDHQKEVERLKEFVELCERLEKLKESGFLDTVADTILKLA